MTSLYAPRDVKAQGEHFLRHDLEMTVYDLRDKFAIAAELAHRDIEIERLRAALADVVDADWSYLKSEADTAQPDSLYNRVRRGRMALTPNVELTCAGTASS